MPQIAQILVSTFKIFRGGGGEGGGGHAPDPPRNFLFFSSAVSGTGMKKGHDECVLPLAHAA